MSGDAFALAPTRAPGRTRRERSVVRGLTSADCVAALETRFEPRAYALIEQVANGTGAQARRWADAVAMSLWPSRGLVLHGFEIKVSRGDWQRELADPEKSAEVQAYCDHWWIVAPAGLIPVADIPPTWGLIEVNAQRRTTIARQAPELEAKPLTRGFVASILRKAHESHDAIVRRERDKARDEGAANGSGNLTRKLASLEATVKDLSDRIAKFREETGIDLRFEWDIPAIGRAVSVLRSRGHDVAADMRRDAERYRAAALQLDKGAAEIAASLPTAGAAE